MCFLKLEPEQLYNNVFFILWNVQIHKKNLYN